MEIDATRIFRALLAGWKFILATLIVFVALAWGYTEFIATPLYKSETTIYVCPGTAASSSSDVTLARDLVPTYAALIDSDNVMEQVFVSLYSDTRQGDNVMHHIYSVSSLRSMKNVSAVDDTEVVCITVTCADAHDAQLIADQIVASAESVITNTIRATAFTIVDYATLPTTPCSPSMKKNLILAVIVAFVLSCGIIILVDLLDRRIKDYRTLADILPVPIIGVIPDFD